jgi:hypothetical protein
MQQYRDTAFRNFTENPAKRGQHQTAGHLWHRRVNQTDMIAVGAVAGAIAVTLANENPPAGR